MTYTSTDGVRELPIFTSRDYLFEPPADAVLITVRGEALWPRLLELVKPASAKLLSIPDRATPFACVKT
jgi:hypothetical protein